MDQYQDPSRYRVLWTRHADGDPVSADGEGYDEADLQSRQSNLPGDQKGEAPWAYEVSILRLCNSRRYVMGEFVVELWAFMKERKKFWLLPIVIVLMFFSILMVLTQGSVLAPFVYTLF